MKKDVSVVYFYHHHINILYIFLMILEIYEFLFIVIYRSPYVFFKPCLLLSGLCVSPCIFDQSYIYIIEGWVELVFFWKFHLFC